MRDSSETEVAAAAEWGASDALLLEGLSGLDQRFAKPAPSETEKPVANESDLPLETGVSVAGMIGFRSARELRAAQERVAALQRSAARRRDGVTQALGLSQPPNFGQQLERQPTPAPKVSNEGAVSFSENGVASQGQPMRQVAAATSPKSEMKTAPAKEVSQRAVPVERLKSSEAKVTPQRERVTLEPRPAKELGKEPQPQTSEGDGKLIPPQMEPMVRRRRTTSSFLPSVLTSLLLTTLVWGAILFTAWRFVGEEWFENRVQEAASGIDGSGDQLRLSVQTLSQDVRNLEDRLTLFRAGHQRFVRMNALEASLYADNSRQKYEDLVEIGEDLETGSTEEEFYQRTKGRIEQAYIKRIAQHPGLDTGKYFPESGERLDQRVGKEALSRFVNDQAGLGWDRARAAFLLRKFKDSDTKVIAQLLQIIRDDEDLQVIFVAWDSLLFMTGYDAGSKGFQPADFGRWWSTGDRG